MENPDTWGDAENVIHNAIVQDHYAKQAEPGLCGLSLARQIADALRAAGLLKADVAIGLRERITVALDVSIDRCARCKVCEQQVDAVMAAIGQ